MTTGVKCPICDNASFENYGGKCEFVTPKHGDSAGYQCDTCGRFDITNSLACTKLDPERCNLSAIQRAGLSHIIRNASIEDTVPLITTTQFDQFLINLSLPTPALQATNIIKYIGDFVMKTGEMISILPLDFHSMVGAVNREAAAHLTKELCEHGFIKAIDATSLSGTNLRNVTLTLNGWDKYEEERKGKFSGKYGFIAMKFYDSVLDPFVENVVKPSIKNGIGYDLVDLRNVARAGVIDNIMRTQIRDAAFVIVDLTHDNPGAYWEAGYAEGLGKPVIYICEKTKFDDAKTHFDTNHCTTVPWSIEDETNFEKELVATLRRSLNLFTDEKS